jgi:hypothetical protein
MKRQAAPGRTLIVTPASHHRTGDADRSDGIGGAAP